MPIFQGLQRFFCQSNCQRRDIIPNIRKLSNVKSGPVTSRNRPHIVFSYRTIPEDIINYLKQVNYIIPGASWQGAYFLYPFFKAHQNLTGCNMGYNMGRNVD